MHVNRDGLGDWTDLFSGAGGYLSNAWSQITSGTATLAKEAVPQLAQAWATIEQAKFPHYAAPSAAQAGMAIPPAPSAPSIPFQLPTPGGGLPSWAVPVAVAGGAGLLLFMLWPKGGRRK